MASKVTGIDETVAAIRAVGRTVNPAVRKSSNLALQPIKKAAKDNLVANGSVKRGVLHASVAIRSVKASKGLMTHQVAATGKGNSIAHFVEFGTDPHWQPKRGIMHPGADPKPFLTPAYHQHDDEAVRIFGRTILASLMAQLNRKSRK